MNQITAADAMVKLLELHGVEIIFGLCGDTSLPFYDALYRTDESITHILARDERHAAYMADGYARVSGKVGVCEGPSGGGATYILPGLVEANESSIPVLGITSDISVTARGRYTLTELDQQALMAPLTKWNKVIEHGSALPRAVRSAFRHMTTGRPGAVHLGLPLDVQRQPVDESELWAEDGIGRYPAWRSAPSSESVELAADALLSARMPLFICGGGILISGAQEELRILAEMLDAPVATTVSGQGSISEHHPLAVGVVGSNGGTPQTRDIVDQADLVLLSSCRAGSVTTERWQHPAPGTTRIVHIDIDPSVIGTNYETEAALVGDAKLALAALAEEITHRAPVKRGSNVQDLIARATRAKFAAFNVLANSRDKPIRPERVVASIHALLPEDAIIVADPGTPCPYFSAYYRWRKPGRHFITNRAHGALGFSLAAALGAHFGRPEAQCVAIMGDGSFGMAVGELETIKRLNIPVTSVVIANGGYGWIKAGQKSGFGERYFSVDFSASDHAAIARAYGLKAWRVEDPDELSSALQAAFECGEPALVDVICQPLQDANAPVSEWIA